MKRFMSLCAVVALPMVCSAAEYFVGVGGEGIRYEKKILLDTVSKNEETDAFGFRVKAGATFDKSYRFSILNSHFSKDEDKLNTTTLNYDYISPINDKLDLFVGLHVGYSKFTSENIKANGLAYGVQGGLLYELLPNLELETGVSYTQYDVDKSFTESFVTYDLELKKSVNMNMGLNLKF
jgi:opacity protein-like surface antigen